MELNIMRHNTEAEVYDEVATSLSHRGSRRFELKEEGSRTLIRAVYSRNFETVSVHDLRTLYTMIKHVIIQHVIAILNSVKGTL